MKKRELNIEFIRIFAIFMTVMIHVSNLYINSFSKISSGYFNTAVVYNSVSRICVPLFFMVSGIFLIKQEFNLKNYFKKIFKFTLILVVWSIIYFLFNNKLNLSGLKEAVANSFLSTNETSRHLWFMYAIIGLYIALPFIQNMCKNMTRVQENLFLGLWLGFSGLVSIYVPLIRAITGTNVDVSYPIPIISGTYYLGYFIAGHILYERFKDTRADLKKNFYCIACYVISTLISIIITCLMSAKNGSVYTPMTWYRSIFIALGAIAVFIFIVINKDKFKGKVILSFSRQSFGIYLIHMIFLNLLSWNVKVISFNPIIAIPVITLGVYIISFVSSYVISKIPILNRLVV